MGLGFEGYRQAILVPEAVSFGGGITHDLKTAHRLGRKRQFHSVRSRPTASAARPRSARKTSITFPSAARASTRRTVCARTIERLLHTVPPTRTARLCARTGHGMRCVQKVAAYLTQTFGEAYRAQDIYMTDGASSALAILTRALLCPGDEAIVLAPYFPEYRRLCRGGGRQCCASCRASADTFAARPCGALDAAVTRKDCAAHPQLPEQPIRRGASRARSLRR